MAESQENEKTHEIMDILEKIISNIDYELMEENLRRFDDIDEEPTIEDLAGLLFYATQFVGGDSLEAHQPDDDSSTGPVEWNRDDVVAVPATQAAVEAPSDRPGELRSRTAMDT